MAHSMPSSSRKLETPASDSRLVEVWGDTVDVGHLGKAIVIGGVVSLTCYLVASRVLATFVDTPDRARAYAMLVGLAGCLVSGVICARLFPPKREVVGRGRYLLARGGAGADGRRIRHDRLGRRPAAGDRPRS